MGFVNQPRQRLALVVALFVALTAASATVMVKGSRLRPGHNMLALRSIHLRAR